MRKDINYQIGCYISRISHDKKLCKNNILKQHGITLSQVRVMFCLWEQEGLTQTDVQKMLSITPASLSGLVDLLIKKGFLVRSEDENDARVKRLYLTVDGRNLQEKVIDDLYHFEDKMTEGFTTEEKALLALWLRKIMDNISREMK